MHESESLHNPPPPGSNSLSTACVPQISLAIRPTPSREIALLDCSAVHQVLHLPELLEQILLHSSQRDLLLSQRVSVCFRQTITSSHRLQKALFLIPDWKLEDRTPVVSARSLRIGRPENNRLLLRAFPGCYPTVTLVIVHDQNPTGEKSANSVHRSWDVCISFPSHGRPNTSPAVLYPEASWRRMFLSQPPCTSLHLVRRWQRNLLPAIVREDGIQMGEFVDEATKFSLIGSVSTLDGAEAEQRREAWCRRFVASDRDWHFEGNIRCARSIAVGGVEGSREGASCE